MMLKLPAPVLARWRGLDAREQTLLRSAGWVLGLALLWWLFIGPPLAMLRQAEAQQRDVDSQLQKMQNLQSQAQALQSQPKISADDAVRALEASVKQRLGGSAQLSVVGDRATVVLRNTPADALAQWLAQARVNARAVPSEARLTRSVTPSAPVATGIAVPSAPITPTMPSPSSPLPTSPAVSRQSPGIPPITPASPATNNAAGGVAWDGTLVLSLPTR